MFAEYFKCLYLNAHDLVTETGKLYYKHKRVKIRSLSLKILLRYFDKLRRFIFAYLIFYQFTRFHLAPEVDLLILSVAPRC